MSTTVMDIKLQGKYLEISRVLSHADLHTMELSGTLDQVMQS